MWLTENILDYGSVAVVGLAKNVGKTVTLNHILRGLRLRGKIGVTSIGIDGETLDAVTGTRKPEIRLYRGMLFATSEVYYRNRRLQSEILQVGEKPSVLGRLVTASVLAEGKVMLSGPSDTASLKRLIDEMHELGASTVIVDGALSRLSPASPAVTDALVLATGAALAPDINTIVKKTVAVCRLIEIPIWESDLAKKLVAIDRGIWKIDEKRGFLEDTGLKSTLELSKAKENLLKSGGCLYVAGMINDRFLRFLSGMKKKNEKITVICRDFTKIFVDSSVLNAFVSNGGEIRVLKRPELIGITINPWSPQGYVVDGKKLKEKLQEKLKDISVEDLMN